MVIAEPLQGGQQGSLRFGAPGVGYDEVAAFSRQVILQYLLPGSMVLSSVYIVLWAWKGQDLPAMAMMWLTICGASWGLQRLGRSTQAVVIYLIASYFSLFAYCSGVSGDANGLASGSCHLMSIYPLLIWVCSSKRWQRLASVGVVAGSLIVLLSLGQGQTAPLVIPSQYLMLSFIRCLFMLATVVAVAHVFDLSVERFAQRSRQALASKNATVVELDARAHQLIREAAAHRNTLAELQQSETRYRHLFDNAFDGIVIYDGRADEPIEINETLANRLGYTSSQITQCSLLELSPEHQADGTLTTLSREHVKIQLLQNSSVRYCWRHKTKHGDLVDFDIHTFHLPGSNEIRVSMLRDVTGQLRAERKLLEANRELRSFAHAASHDLKEPLRTMSTFATLIARRYSEQLDDSGRQYIGFITEAAARGTRLVHDLLRYAEVGTDQVDLVDIDLSEIGREVAATVRTRLEEASATLEIGPLPTIRATTTWAQQLLQNLISNALKFKRPGVAPYVCVTAKQIGSTWEVRVRDNGIGIAEQDIERAFGVFTRLVSSSEYEGSGVGLALCRRIMDKLGGDIRVESELGVGTTFILSFNSCVEHASPTRAQVQRVAYVGQN